MHNSCQACKVQAKDTNPTNLAIDLTNRSRIQTSDLSLVTTSRSQQHRTHTIPVPYKSYMNGATMGVGGNKMPVHDVFLEMNGPFGKEHRCCFSALFSCPFTKSYTEKILDQVCLVCRGWEFCSFSSCSFSHQRKFNHLRCPTQNVLSDTKRENIRYIGQNIHSGQRH